MEYTEQAPARPFEGFEFLGIEIGGRSLEDLITEANHSIEWGRPQFTMACANPHSLVTAHADPVFCEALRSSTAVVADGSGVKLAGLLTGIKAGPRITGWDFFHGMMTRLNDRGGKAFFFGSRDVVLKRILVNAWHDYPRVEIEVLSPPFGDWSAEQNEAMLTRIRESQPDVLWVGMTAPRQEKWTHANAAHLGVPVIGSIGAVFDYYAGTVQRAPGWICAIGLEWLYRLAGEPRRLWRRTVVSAPRFLWLVARERLATRWQREAAQQ